MKEPKITFHVLREDYTYRSIAEQVQHYLEEKLVIVGGGANYGQVVFLAGGAGSGKGFAIKNYMEGNKFKVFDPDAFKDAFLNLSQKMKDPKVNSYLKVRFGSDLSPTIKGVLSMVGKLDLRDPKDTGIMHMYIKGLGVEEKRIVNFFSPAARASAGGTVVASTLPNVLFDNTMKDATFLTGENGQGGIIDTLLSIGYKKENFHIVWVLTDCNIAIEQNFTRDRVVPTSILFQTHRGAAATMQDLIFKSYGSLGINGDIAVIIGGKNKLVKKKGDAWTDTKTGKTYRLERDIVSPLPMEWDYFKVKKQGQMSVNQGALERIRDKIMELAPKPTDTPELMQAAAIERLREKGKLESDVVKNLGVAPDAIRDIPRKVRKSKSTATPLAKWLRDKAGAPQRGIQTKDIRNPGRGG